MWEVPWGFTLTVALVIQLNTKLRLFKTIPHILDLSHAGCIG